MGYWDEYQYQYDKGGWDPCKQKGWDPCNDRNRSKDRDPRRFRCPCMPCCCCWWCCERYWDYGWDRKY